MLRKTKLFSLLKFLLPDADRNLLPLDKPLLKPFKTGGDKSDIKAMCKKKEINNAVLANLRECAKTGKLTKVDTPIAVHLETEPWLPETGLVTDALKLKRKVNSLSSNRVHFIHSFVSCWTSIMLLLLKTCTRNNFNTIHCAIYFHPNTLYKKVCQIYIFYCRKSKEKVPKLMEHWLICDIVSNMKGESNQHVNRKKRKRG